MKPEPEHQAPQNKILRMIFSSDKNPESELQLQFRVFAVQMPRFLQVYQ